MKKNILYAAIAFSLLTLNSCGGNKSKAGAENVAAASEDSPAMQLLNSVPFTEEGLKSMIKTPEGQALSDVEYEALWLAYSKAEIDEKKLELAKNPVTQVRREILKEHDKPSNAAAIQDRLLSNPSPQVRGMAMGMYGSLFGVSKENVAKLKDALSKEKEPFVIKECISALANEMKKDGVSDLVLGQIDNSNKFVRAAVARAVGNYWSIGVPGVKDAAKKLIGDKDEEVRKAMLGSVGKLEDESFVPDLVKVLNDDSQHELHDECMRSLYKLWYDYPFHKLTSKSAYDATINYLKKKPRTKDVPNWVSIGELRSKAEKDYAAWKSKATYYSDAEYIKIMADIAADPNANWLGRTAAIDVIAKIGTKADLQKLNGVISSNSNDEKKDLVLKSFEKTLAK